MTTGRPAKTGRAHRHLLVAGFVLAYLAAGGVTFALGDRVAGGDWLALHLVLLGAATNAIVVWSEHFAAALLRAPPVAERTATARALALNLGIVAVLGGVHTRRPALAAAGACLAGLVVLGHALALAIRIGRALPARLSRTVWFYVAAGAALLAGMGLGLWLAGGVVSSAEAYLALRLAHAHLNVLGWIGLTVVGTQFTLWPTVLRTRMVPGLERAVRWSLPPLGWGSRWSRSSARRWGGRCEPLRPGYWAPAWPGWWWRSPVTWLPWPSADGWSSWTAGWPGWSRPWSLGSHCRP
jgi:nitrite reductase (NO-forming)